MIAFVKYRTHQRICRGWKRRPRTDSRLKAILNFCLYKRPIASRLGAGTENEEGGPFIRERKSLDKRSSTVRSAAPRRSDSKQFQVRRLRSISPVRQKSMSCLKPSERSVSLLANRGLVHLGSERRSLDNLDSGSPGIGDVGYCVARSTFANRFVDLHAF